MLFLILRQVSLVVGAGLWGDECGQLVAVRGSVLPLVALQLWPVAVGSACWLVHALATVFLLPSV